MRRLEIGDRIIGRIEAEARAAVTQIARGYVEITDEQGKDKVIWLVRGELQRGHTQQRNIVGDIVGTTEKDSPYFKGGGVVISKNSPFGNALAELDECTGLIRYKTPTGMTTSQILAKAEYQVNSSLLDATQGVICSEVGEFPFEESLREQINQLRELFEARRREGANEEELQALQEEIQALEEEIATQAMNARRYRRTTSSIRQKFMLDPDQNRIKRLKLFNGPLVINGGPGTGKTTLLIHKIQYMLDKEVENDENLTTRISNEEWVFIRNQKTGWIFFSPTDLLKKYLQDAMTAEGLEATEDTVKTWHQQRNALKTAFGFFGTEKSRVFLSYTDKGQLWYLNAGQLNKLLGLFDTFFIEHIVGKISKLTKLKLTELPWSKECITIRMALQSVEKGATLSKLILALDELMRTYGELRMAVDTEYTALSNRVSSSVGRLLSEEDKAWFISLLRERRSAKAESNTEEEEQDREDLIDAFEEEELIDGQKVDIDISRLIKKVIRAEALSEIDANTSVTKGDKEVLERISKYLDRTNYPQIAAYSLFIKYFKPFLKGSDNTILSQLPRVYKSFRRNVLKSADWLDDSVKQKIAIIIDTAPRNTRLHDDELDLLILLALRLSRVFYSTSPETYRGSKNTYLVAHNSYMKGLVAIDEATDFSPVQIHCMYHLSRPRLNAVLMAGDIMQQMSKAGINAWSDIDAILPDTEIASLNKSYRQTARLLNLAIRLHEARYNERPLFYASEPETENDPAPLVHLNAHFDDKINWIAERIRELYHVYESTIPNIAVFVKDDEAIKSVSQALNDNQLLLEKGITVKGCVGEGEIGSAEFVRVFNINLIKGMEFESVFFFDVDEYEDVDQQILDKLIYVGISRATYYLAITLKHKFPDLLKPIEPYLVAGNWNAKLESDY